MNISITSILLGIGGKCLLNWALVFLQRRHICRSFVGIFSVSLAAVDTALTVLFTTTHMHSNRQFSLWGLKVTTYHTCLLAQVLGQVYSALQWPIVLAAVVDHLCTVSLQPACSGAKWIVRSAVTVLLWYLATQYVFLLSDFTPVMEDVPHHQLHRCWDCGTTWLFQVVMVLSLAMGCAALRAECGTRFSKNPSRRRVICQVLRTFLNTWGLFFVFLTVLFVLPLGIPSYLDLNVAWLCFLNSFLIAVVLCVVCPTSRFARGLASVPPDSFCEWGFKFSLAAEDRT